MLAGGSAGRQEEDRVLRHKRLGRKPKGKEAKRADFLNVDLPLLHKIRCTNLRG